MWDSPVSAKAMDPVASDARCRISDRKVIHSARRMDIPFSDWGGKPAVYVNRTKKEPARKFYVDKAYGVIARDSRASARVERRTLQIDFRLPFGKLCCDTDPCM